MNTNTSTQINTAVTTTITHTIANPKSINHWLPQWLTQAIASLLMFCILFVPLLTPLAQAKETITYVHHDALGNGLVATNQQAQVLWRERFHPFGQPIVETEPSKTQRAMFHGKPYDRDTGLSYFGARDYDPILGRFMGIDPVSPEPGKIHSFNRYSYGNNNPLKYTDPDGLAPKKINPSDLFRHNTVEKVEKSWVKKEPIAKPKQSPATSEKGGDKSQKADEGTKKGTEKASTLKPGPFAKESIPGHQGKPTAEEQRQINDLMKKNGCHTCGTKDPGTKSGNAIVDHQPPKSLEKTKYFYPHCIECMRRQGGETRTEIRRRKK